ncbi:hypothetical protein PCASD_05935 [Puccinia coronata f. sp. avenae]|uniref:serine--tRNA ligase n=1 Tax=Puccinia coronata f. sp. avenae TaxID=200324 RepID=A0A2N5V626_9BASI|nr:hypothetical protein PCASD_05935 [Puccinia coronata f. sp. avenae]
MAQLPSSLARPLRRRFSVSASASSSSGSSGPSVPGHPPRPVIDYARITSNRTACGKNLVDRKSHLTPDAVEDVAYLYGESRNLSKKLLEAKQRQNSLGNKIKQAIGSLSVTATTKKEDSLNRAKDGDDEDLLLDQTPLPRKKTSDPLQQSLGSNLELAAKVNEYHSEAASLKDAISNLSKDGMTLEQRLLELATQLPNETHPSVPIGPYEQSEIVSLSSGCTLSADPLPFNSFQVPARPPDPNRDHLKIMTELGWLSFADGQKTTGPSFPFLIGNGAFLELALTQYAISLVVRAGWNLALGPDIVRTDLSERCGFAPRDGGETNHTYFVSTHKTIHSSEEEEKSLNPPSTPNLCLAATSEIPLVGSFHSSTLPNKSYPTFPLNPIQLVSLGTAYRAEAGARGSESRGLYRIHQFKKVEMMAITGSDLATSEKVLQKMVDLQIQIVASLNLPYRVLEMSSQELGASAYHKYDIETWMPGRGRWGEVSSASNCTDYQSRRLGIRTKARPPVPDPNTTSDVDGVTGEENKAGSGSRRTNEKAGYVHTLNATAAAMPRLIVSLVENGVLLDQNNSPIGIKLPAPLKPFWLGGSKGIEWVPSHSSP